MSIPNTKAGFREVWLRQVHVHVLENVNQYLIVYLNILFSLVTSTLLEGCPGCYDMA